MLKNTPRVKTVAKKRGFDAPKMNGRSGANPQTQNAQKALNAAGQDFLQRLDARAVINQVGRVKDDFIAFFQSSHDLNF